MARYSLIATLICNVIVIKSLVGSNSSNLLKKASNCISPIVAIFQGMSFVGSQGLLVARTYAVARGSRIVFAFLSALTLLNLGALLVTIVEDVSQNCSGTIHLTMKAVESFQLVTTLVFESVTIIVIFHYTRRGFIERKLLWTSEESLSSLLLRQGIYRYIIIFTWTLIDEVGSQASVVVDYTVISINNLTTESSRTTFAILETFFRQGTDAPLENAISTILICRIILEMREVAIRSMAPPTTIVTVSTWKVRTAILEDFGDDLSFYMQYQTRVQNNEVEDTEEESDVGAAISITEFPWASGFT
ncbi:hypothetical protein BU17DRAFT_63544 [Hysterangium stoloniferum]|nr:hypothetical protein BU17DRAFT_63544 [Hysterangium stoloniferum]